MQVGPNQPFGTKEVQKQTNKKTPQEQPRGGRRNKVNNQEKMSHEQMQ